jgi:hypothetical protein
LPLTNSEIVRLYLAGMPLCDLTARLKCSVERVKTILHAYDIPVRTRSEAVRAANLSRAEQVERRIARARALGPPTD